MTVNLEPAGEAVAWLLRQNGHRVDIEPNGSGSQSGSVSYRATVSHSTEPAQVATARAGDPGARHEGIHPREPKEAPKPRPTGGCWSDEIGPWIDAAYEDQVVVAENELPLPQ